MEIYYGYKGISPSQHGRSTCMLYSLCYSSGWGEGWECGRQYTGYIVKQCILNLVNLVNLE